MNIDALDEDGASNIAHPELFGKPNKSELMKHLEKCEKIVQTWPKWKIESIRNAFGIPDSSAELKVDSKVKVDFISESRTIFSGKRFTGTGVVDRLEDGRVFGRLDDGRTFLCFPSDVTLFKGEEVMSEILDKATEELVDNFATAMKQKLLKAQIKYGFKSDWLNNGWEKDCQSQLNNHVLKGDPLDVAAYCAFMWFHNWKTISKPNTYEQGKIYRLNKFVSDVLDIEGIMIEDIKSLAKENGYFCVLVGGDEHHGSYSIRQKYNTHIVTITKCHCGHIHLLEDMCVECNPDLKDNFLGNGTPIAIIQSDCNPQHELTIETHEGLILSHPLSNDEMRAIQTMAVSMTPRKKLLKNFFHSVRNQPEESFSHIQKWIESILASTNTAFFTVQIKHLNQTAKPMKALKITWLEPCQLCGFSEYLNVTTEKGTDRLLHNEDEVKCPNCGNTGEIFCDDNAAAVNWHTELPF